LSYIREVGDLTRTEFVIHKFKVRFMSHYRSASVIVYFDRYYVTALPVRFQPYTVVISEYVKIVSATTSNRGMTVLLASRCYFHWNLDVDIAR
jgi:hypothetical protein